MRAEQERRYLNSTRNHAGVTVPGVRAIAKEVAPLEHDALIAVTERLWLGPFYECCAAAVELLELVEERHPELNRTLDRWAADPDFCWVLRDTSRRRPELVHAWLLPRAARASGVTIREAVTYLPEEQRAEILAVLRGRGRVRLSRDRGTPVPQLPVT